MGEKEIESTPDFPGCFCFSAGVFRGLPRSCSPQARFRQSIQAVCQGDYTAAQLSAWAGRAETIMAKHLLACDTLVAEEKGCLLGFANLEPGGYLDCLYTAAESQRRGVAAAWRQGEKLLRVEASRTTRGFFEHRGFRVQAAQLVPVDGEDLENLRMQKVLEPIVSQETAE